MSMLNERLQIMVSEDQRHRLEEEARRRGSSIATIVRDAIDEHIGVPTRDDRRRALDAITAMNGRYRTPDELEAIASEERENAGRAG